jgi:hypothetical protein
METTTVTNQREFKQIQFPGHTGSLDRYGDWPGRHNGAHTIRPHSRSTHKQQDGNLPAFLEIRRNARVDLQHARHKGGCRSRMYDVRCFL